jgi:hypothetical protein
LAAAPETETKKACGASGNLPNPYAYNTTSQYTKKANFYSDSMSEEDN